ncbi:MAG: hypothetical protein IPH30_09095 [Betaproteobacteria bacterium]|nr:hypothetical protein [Betaproteobacteria bacterium]
MPERPDDLALRKEILVARASLCRLKIRLHAGTLRQGLTWRHAVAGVAGSAPARDAALLLVAEGVGRHRVARWLAFAIRALAIARLTHLAVSMLKQSPAGPADPPPP